MPSSPHAVFYNDGGGDFAANFREDLLQRIRDLEPNLKPEGEYYESEKILYYLVILTTLIRHVPFEECLNEFVAIDPDEIRQLKVKFMAVWEQQFVADSGGSEEMHTTYLEDHRELVEKTFDDFIEASENPPPPI